MDENKIRKSQNALGLFGVILMGVMLFLFVVSVVVMFVSNRVAVYSEDVVGYNSNLFGTYAILYYFLIDFYPILVIANMAAVYLAFCKSYNTRHLVVSTLLGFLSVAAYTVSFFPLSMLDSPMVARGADVTDSAGFVVGWFNVSVFVLLFVIVFTCFVQIAFLLYFNKVRKRINYTQIMNRYERFRYVPLATALIYFAMFACYMII